MRQAARSAFLLALLSPALGSAHAPPQATGLEWSVEGGDDRLFVRTNRGLIVGEGPGAPWRLLCNDAYQASLSESASLRATPAGLLIGSYAGGLRLASSDLCALTPAPLPFPGQTLVALASAAQPSATVYALTLPGETEPGRLYASADGGRRFEARANISSFATSLGVASLNEATLYVAQTNLDDPNAPIPEIAVSRDGGRQFTRRPLELNATEFRSFVLGVDATNAERVFVRTQGRNHLDPERLLLSEDGGESWTTVFSGLGPLSLALDAVTQQVWVGGFDGLFRSQDGGRSFQPTDSAPLARIGCLGYRAGRLYACGFEREFGVFVSLDAGDSFAPYLRFPDVTEPVSCAPDVPSATQCQGSFEDWSLEQSLASAPAGAAGAPSSPVSAPPALRGTVSEASCGYARCPLPVTLTWHWLMTVACLAAAARRARRLVCSPAAR